ncbi:site-specific integrase [Streptococcus suis]|uniref:Site-specific integrase n=1 Tax=Streptococcus suis TaxID=1307 RepID=A0A4T2GHZ6_STRSU|nr:site-specific integrase [Streptococcus suis]MBM7270642.1 site-specific integrase [Streptococcus suis]TIH98131.1 site-specific integrase [Streptococcus suis]
MKYNKTNYPNIFWYDTAKGKRYHIRRGFTLNGKKKEANKSGLKTIAEARAALAEIERQIAENEFDVNKNLTCDQYWEVYCENRLKTGKWAPDTEYNKRSIYTNHFQARFGNTKLDDIKRLDYEAYINDKLAGMARHSVVQTHGVFNAMMNHARNNKIINDNPIDKIDIGQSARKPRVKRRSLAEFKAWDKAAKEILDDYEYTIVRVTYYGLRRSEDAGIQLGLLTKRIDGRYLLELKESRTRLRPGGAMKTEESGRYCLFDPETSRYLDKAIQTSHKIAKKYGRILGPEDYLFLIDYKNARNYLRGAPIRVEYIYHLFKKVSKFCGIHFSPHVMRHFFSTQGQAAGVPIEHMAAALGHSTTYMTQKYTHISDEVAESVSDSFMRAIK